MAKPQNKPIVIESDQRILLIAAPKDGKTTLAVNLLGLINPKRLVVVNPAADKDLYQVFGEGRLHIDPDMPPVQHLTPMVTDDYRKYSFWWQIVKAGNTFTYIDELAQVSDSRRYNIGLKYQYQMGRRRFCGTMAATQRALEIPRFTFAFSEHVFVGHVEGADLARVEEATGKRWAHLIEQRKPHQFAYWSRLERDEPRFIN